MNTAIIVAAGSGTRFDSATPKQFLDLCGKPVILHTLEKFQACPDIDAIVAVVCSGEIDVLRAITFGAGLTKLTDIVAGGKTRVESVSKGFDAIDPATTIVCVHDGVRPLVTVDEIARTVDSALQNGAACLVAPVTDTIKTIDYGKITGTVDRASLRRALTPQAFLYSVLRQALDEAEMDETVTDECLLVERSGVMITVVEGSPRNIKITHREDMTAAEVLIREDVK